MDKKQNSQRTSVSTFVSPQVNAQTQAFKRSSTFATQERISKFFLLRFKKIKNATYNPTPTDKKSKRTMLLKPNIDNGLQRRAYRTPAANRVMRHTMATLQTLNRLI